MGTDGFDRDVSVRLARFDDLDGLHELDLKVFDALAYPFFVLRQMFDMHDGCWLVADHPTGLVGYSLAAPTWDRKLGWLLALAVKPEHRGRGHGARLTLESLERLKVMGVPEVRLTVEPGNDVAVALYRRVGFEVMGRRREYFGPGEDRVIMARSLGQEPLTAIGTRPGAAQGS